MVRKGTVVELNRADKSGVIEDANGREFFFHVEECIEQILPGLWSEVSFLKDPDFKTIDVAMLVRVGKPSNFDGNAVVAA